jgi:hypothetical protein
MAKGKYDLIPHDDKDILYFKEIYGERELEDIFLNEEDKTPKINNHGLCNQLKPNIIQFVTVDDIELIFNYHLYLFEKLTKKIKNYQYKESTFQTVLERLIESSGQNIPRAVDTSILEHIESQLYKIIHPSTNKINVFSHVNGKPLYPKDNVLQKSNQIEESARDIAEKLIVLSDETYRNLDRYPLPGTTTEFLAHITGILLIDTTQAITNQWLEFEKSVSERKKADVDEMCLAMRTQIAMTTGSYHHVVKTFLTATFFILHHIEELHPVAHRSKTLSPDEYIYSTQNKRTYGEGSKNKLISVPIYFRNVIYKVWLYYWQHAQPKFQNATPDATDTLRVTGPEMIMALDEAFPLTQMGSKDSSSDTLATRRNLISDIYKYPSLVDHYFNHEG